MAASEKKHGGVRKEAIVSLDLGSGFLIGHL
jgi:hypothetical protein